MAFADAIRLSAKIVVCCEAKSGEVVYEGVQAIWRRLGELF
jgi:hypothetical protein